MASRRNFLKGAAVLGGTSMISFPQLFGVAAQDGEGDDPQLILNLAATAETFACVHYYTAINSAEALSLTENEINWLKAFLDSEYKHKVFLESNGAVPVATEFYVPENLFTDRATFVATTNAAENWFVAAYLAATRRFAELDMPELAATASQVSGVESEHQALIRLMGDMQPSFQTLKEPLFWNTSEVVPFFQPFLDGSGEGFVGPAAYPGDAEIQALVGGQEVENVTPYIALTPGMGTVAMMAAQPAPATTGPCTVSGNNTNVRATPSTDAAVSGSLTNGTPMNVIGQTTGADGMTWYQIDMGWVRADAVTLGGDCSAVPMVSM